MRAGSKSSCFAPLALFVLALAAPVTGTAYVGRCPTCGTVDKVERIAYERGPGAAAREPGAVLGAVEGRADGEKARTLPGRPTRRNAEVAGERGTRLEIRMDKGGTRTIDVHGDPRIYRGDRVKVFRDRVELL